MRTRTPRVRSSSGAIDAPSHEASASSARCACSITSSTVPSTFENTSFSAGVNALSGCPWTTSAFPFAMIPSDTIGVPGRWVPDERGAPSDRTSRARESHSPSAIGLRKKPIRGIPGTEASVLTSAASGVKLPPRVPAEPTLRV